MLYTIDEIKEKTIPIAKAYGIKSMGLFGSYARGEADDDSDVDLYIDKGRLQGLIQYFSFVDELEKKLNCHVDVVSTGGLDREFLDCIIEEGIVFYEGEENEI